MATYKLNNFSIAPSGWLLTVNMQKLTNVLAMYGQNWRGSR